MFRTLAGVVLGYIVVAVIVVAGSFAAVLGLGPDGVFVPGAYAPNPVYRALNLAIGLAAAVAAGAVARWVGGTRTAVLVLVLLVVVLGGGMAAVAAAEPRREAPPRGPGEALDTEKMKSVQQPLWVALANPVIGAVGLLVGGRAWRT